MFDSLKPLKIISRKAKKLGVPVLFTGDWDHTPKFIENKTNYYSLKTYKENFEKFNVDLYAISGNHDFCERNHKEHRSISHLDPYDLLFNTFNKMDWDTIETENFIVSGIPYLDYNLGFVEQVTKVGKYSPVINKPHILLIHTDLPGAINAFKHKIDSADNIPKNWAQLFEPFDLVLSGHIHKKQWLAKNVLMTGAPDHQDRGDTGEDMGYWVIYSDRKPQFKKIDLPQFIYVESEEEIKDDGNYYTVLDTPNSDPDDEEPTLKATTSRKKLVKRYLKMRGEDDKQRRQLLIELLESED